MSTYFLIGTHGTCGTYAEQIDADGFHPSSGWRGTGVYFWECDPEAPEIAQELARMWSEMRISRNSYPDKVCVVYSASISDEANALNLRLANIRNAYVKFAKEYLERTGHELRHDDKCLIFDEFVEMIERDTGNPIAIVKAEDETPRTKDLKLLHVLPAYKSFTVLDESCIVSYKRE